MRDLLAITAIQQGGGQAQRGKRADRVRAGLGMEPDLASGMAGEKPRVLKLRQRLAVPEEDPTACSTQGGRYERRRQGLRRPQAAGAKSRSVRQQVISIEGKKRGVENDAPNNSDIP